MESADVLSILEHTVFSGYTNRQNALAPVWTSFMTMAVGSISVSCRHASSLLRLARN